MVRGLVDVPSTRQYIDTSKYRYQIWQFGTYGLDPALGVLVWLGFAVASCSWYVAHAFQLAPMVQRGHY